LPERFGFELTLDLKRAEIAEQRLLLGGKAIRFPLQCLQAFSRATGERFSTLAVRRLGHDGATQEKRKSEAGKAFHNVRGVMKL
jgi:hypothetical protein